MSLGERRKARQTQKPATAIDNAGLPALYEEPSADDLGLLALSPLFYQDSIENVIEDGLLGPFDLTAIEPRLTVADEVVLNPSNLHDPSPGKLRQAASQNESAILPSPHRNYLQIQKLNFYAARIQNALYMGVPLLLAEKTESTISPWYWHSQFATLLSSPSSANFSNASNLYPSKTVILPDHSIITRPIRRKPCFMLSQIVMPDLAPSPLQRSHPHEMYIDMIPFPVFRDRVITLLSMDPPAFDESELKRDIEAEGLLVWGVGQGMRDRTSSLVRDKRNWECAKWFSNKKLLVNGSGLEEQSR